VGGNGTGDWRLNAAGNLGTLAGNAFVDALFGKPKPSGPSPEQLRAEQLRQQQIAEAQRAEQLRIEAENQRRANFQRAAQLRATLDRAGEEMEEQLGGALDVVRRPRSTNVFGTGNSDVSIQDAPEVVDPNMVDLRPDVQPVLDLEANLRIGDGWNNPMVVDLRDKTFMTPEVPGAPAGAGIVGVDSRGLDAISVPGPGQVAWPVGQTSLINPLREPERYRNLVDRERYQYLYNPILYRSLDRLNHPEFYQNPVMLPQPEDLDLLFPDPDPVRRAAKDATWILRKYAGPIVAPRDEDVRFLSDDSRDAERPGAALRREAVMHGEFIQRPTDQDLQFLFDGGPPNRRN